MGALGRMTRTAHLWVDVHREQVLLSSWWVHEFIVWGRALVQESAEAPRDALDAKQVIPAAWIGAILGAKRI